MAYKAFIMEYERGWGSRLDQTLSFPTKAERDKYVKEYNEKYNTAKEVPDWYMVAVAATD